MWVFQTDPTTLLHSLPVLSAVCTAGLHWCEHHHDKPFCCLTRKVVINRILFIRVTNSQAILYEKILYNRVLTNFLVKIALVYKVALFLFTLEKK